MNLIGQILGQYRIIEPVGVGGMASVFKAYQASLDRYVAVKVLPAQHALTPGFKERFYHEAKAVAQLSHPNILPIHDVGIEGDISYFAMKYVPGHTLKDLLGQPLPLKTASYFVDQMAWALDHAHKQGILHRDIKPANMLLEDNWLLLADFGLAKIVEGTVALTGAGAIMGTPAYMSPEQGKGESVDHRTDIYSLGIVLYEMVTGRVPYEGETPIGVIIKHLNEPLPLPRSINQDLPEAVERVILKALAKNPAERFERAGELAEALRNTVGKSSNQPVIESLTQMPAPPLSEALAVGEAETVTSEPGKTAPARSEKATLSKTMVSSFGSLASSQPGWLWFGGLLILIILGTTIVSVIGGRSDETSSTALSSDLPTSEGAIVAAGSNEPPTSISSPSSIPTPTVDTNATATAIAIGIFATQTASVPTATNTPFPTNMPTPTDTSLPTDTATLRPTATPIPTPTHPSPTLSPIPVPTLPPDVALEAALQSANSNPEAAFAMPALQAATTSVPTYRDDFLDPSTSKFRELSIGDSFARHENGVYLMAAHPANTKLISRMTGGLFHTDIVARYDIRIDPFESSFPREGGVYIRESTSGLYQFAQLYYGAELSYEVALGNSEFGGNLATGFPPAGSDRAIGTWHNLIAVLVGNRIAYFMDGTLVAMVIDDNLTQGEFTFYVSPGSAMQVDNLRIWDVNNLN